MLAAHWGTSQTVLLTIAVLILLILIILMSTRKPGPASPSDDIYGGEPAPEHERAAEAENEPAAPQEQTPPDPA
jgi:hypothetical protein